MLDNNLLLTLKQKLRNELPIEMEMLSPPYPMTVILDEKVQITSKALRRSLKLGDQLESLVNAFYLGRLFDESETTAARFLNKRKTTRYYATISENTFDIFENNPLQIMHTSFLTVQHIRKLSQPQILQL